MGNENFQFYSRLTIIAIAMLGIGWWFFQFYSRLTKWVELLSVMPVVSLSIL
ncbi:hypothetical protein J5U23_01731 [Saccharolobus shibatae B12]|uniref:Uncharacterized protein n=1 Tax=Saccharolobus shibatae (strain ATCC 51178 / DSM 5389 / JCM 8931 / NBRC 15437 / B12) TaxID=523848 RepID=A0A8F5GTZ0_SACSH|nr:hypothetical protein J5U23_01731 [Saccharolobus shibatae B12]